MAEKSGISKATAQQNVDELVSELGEVSPQLKVGESVSVIEELGVRGPVLKIRRTFWKRRLLLVITRSGHKETNSEDAINTATALLHQRRKDMLGNR